MTTQMAPTEMSTPVSAGPPAVHGSHREERCERLEQPIGERRAGTDEDESEPEHQASRPEEELHDEGDRSRRGQDGVLAPRTSSPSGTRGRNTS